MEIQPITIEVDAEAARAYNAASEEQRRKLNTLLSLKLSEVVRADRSLEEVIREMHNRAKRRGLTPEILDSILSIPQHPSHGASTK